MVFSARYLPTSLFSLKASNSTNSGAKTLFLPSPYSIKMAILNQAITVGGQLNALGAKDSLPFRYIRDAKITFFIETGSYYSANNSFVKILKPAREGGGFQPTVAFREYLHISKPLEIIFDVDDKPMADYLKRYLHKINYFGKRGCFFQFMEYLDNPNPENVVPFDIQKIIPGILQEYDDFDPKATFENANNFSAKKALRRKQIYVLPLMSVSASKAFTLYKKI